MLVSTLRKTPLYDDVARRISGHELATATKHLLGLIEEKGFSFSYNPKDKVSLGNSLIVAFNWEDTKQGHDYWSNINNKRRRRVLADLVERGLDVERGLNVELAAEGEV